MIESNQLENPYNPNQTTSGRDVNNTIVDSGLRIGQNTAVVNIYGDLITGNTFNITFNGSTINTAFNTDNDTTIADIITDVTANALVSSVELMNPKRKDTETLQEIQSLKITFVTGVQGNITAANITGGASQANVTYEEFQYLRIIPGQVVVSEDVKLISYTEASTASSVTTTYVGEALPGSPIAAPVWRIKKIVEDASGSPTLTTVLYADGDTKFDNAWSGRAGLSYS